MKVTLIISTYNSPEFLYLVIRSINKQTVAPDEVIFADDGSSVETKKVIEEFETSSRFKVLHAWQEDLGFRVARSRNNAIILSSGEYIILIDGDIVLHPNFIEDHIKNAKLGHFIQGSRVLLNNEITKKAIEKTCIEFPFFSSKLINKKNSIHSNFLSLIFSKKSKNLKGIKTCNMAFYRKDCIRINGFNNDFEGWGREDSEFVVRLMNRGIKRKNIRFNAIVFHLYHNENSRIALEKNDQLLQKTIFNSSTWCENGINKMNKNES
jgi:glycosyltransferase involved in cell wall biosynthesis